MTRIVSDWFRQRSADVVVRRQVMALEERQQNLQWKIRTLEEDLWQQGLPRAEVDGEIENLGFPGRSYRDELAGERITLERADEELAAVEIRLIGLAHYHLGTCPVYLLKR